MARGRTPRALGAATVAVLALMAGAPNAQGAVSDQPQVAVDEDGNAHFTWRRTDGIDIVKTRKRAPNGTFSAAQDLSAAGQDARDTQLAVDPQGNVYFVWSRSNGSNFIVQTRKRNANGTLSAVQNLSLAGQDAVEPQVGVDPQGNAYFTWRRFNGSNYVVQTRKRSANGTLSAVQDLSPAGRTAAVPQLAVDPQGTAYFTWHRFNVTDVVVQFRRRAADGTLGSVQRLSPTGQDAFDPQVGADPQGNASFVWRTSNGLVQTRKRNARGTLSAVQDLTPTDVGAGDPQVAVDPQGNATFVWRGVVGSYNVIQTRRRAAGGTLSEVQDLGAPESNGLQPQVAVDPTGTASFAWHSFSFDPGAQVTTSVVQTRRRTAEGLLSAMQDLSLGMVDTARPPQPQVAVDPLGNAYFVWENAEGEFGIIQTRRRAPDGTLTAVQNVTG